MATWLWIIGIVAFGWPIVLAIYVDRVFTKWVNLIGSRSENAHFADQRAQAFRADLARIQGVVEGHEALIAALWQHAFGFYCEGGFSEPELPEYLGVKPNWRGFTPEYAGRAAYIVRSQPFPWGTSAENLYFGPSSN